MALSVCCSVPIQRRRSISKQEFDENYLKTGTPVVIEGEIDTLPAKDWTLDSLYERVGGNEVFVRTKTDQEEYRLGTQYKIRQTTFAQYVDDLRARNSRGKSSYLAVQNIKKAFPQLVDEVPIPEYIGKVHAGPFLWVAIEGHYEYCHQDPDDGLLIIVNGQKVVRLFGNDMENMYPNPLGSKGRTTQSRVDCKSPDLEEKPKFKDATCMYATLNTGDMLYIPAFCWHQVTTMVDTISINIFWGDAGKNNYLTKIMNQPVWPAFSHWLLNVIEQNRPFDSFPRMLSRLPEALSNFLVTQWHEEATPEQLDILVKHIMEYLQIDCLPQGQITGKFPPKLQIRGLLWRA